MITSRSWSAGFHMSNGTIVMAMILLAILKLLISFLNRFNSRREKGSCEIQVIFLEHLVGFFFLLETVSCRQIDSPVVSSYCNLIRRSFLILFFNSTGYEYLR